MWEKRSTTSSIVLEHNLHIGGQVMPETMISLLDVFLLFAHCNCRHRRRRLRFETITLQPRLQLWVSFLPTTRQNIFLLDFRASCFPHFYALENPPLVI